MNILIESNFVMFNCSHLCIIYVKIFEKIFSGGLEVSFSIHKLKDMLTLVTTEHTFETYGLEFLVSR